MQAVVRKEATRIQGRGRGAGARFGPIGTVDRKQPPHRTHTDPKDEDSMFLQIAGIRL
jgi:hypothetical protein